MIGLYIDGNYVELFNDENIELTKQVRSFQDVTAMVSDYTKSFNVPATDSNNAIFSHYYDISIVNGYNPHVKVTASIEVESIPVFDGVIELLGVDFNHNEPQQYQIVFYGHVKTLASEFGEQTLRDVDWSSYDHDLTQPNVVNSWSDNLFGGAIKYPLWDFYEGVTYADSSVDIAHNINKFGRGFALDDVRPSIRLKDAVEKVIQYGGYNLEPNGLFSDRYFDDMYMLPVNQAGYMHDPALRDTNKFVSSFATAGTRIDSLNFVTRTYTTTTGNAGGGMDGSTGIYTAPISDLYRFSFTINLTSIPTSSYSLATTIAVYVNNTFHSTLMSLTTTGSATEAFYLNLAKGDSVKIKTLATLGFETDSYSFSCTEAPYARGGTNISLSEVMPNMKLTKFLQGVLSTFNAVLYLNGNTYHIENTDSWYDSGSIVDWSEYIDMSTAAHKKLKIPKRISFKFAEMKDMVSENFLNQQQRAFGSMAFEPDVDFTDGELNVSSPFSIVVPSVLNKVNPQYENIGTTDLGVSVLLNNDMKPACGSLVLFYMSSDQYVASDSYYALGSVRNTYPYAGTFQNNRAADGNSLAFSLERTLDGVVPTDTLYSKWWQKYIARIFAKSSRRVTMTAFLPVGEWLNLDMSNTIRVNDYYYKIEDISYNLNTNKATLNLFTYTPLSVISPTSDGSGAVGFPTDYVTPASENLIFNADAVLDNVFNTTLVANLRYVGTGVIPQMVTNTQYLLNSMSNVISNQYPKDVTLTLNETNFLLTTSYTVLDGYDDISDINNGIISGNASSGQISTSYGTWVKVYAKINWDGNHHVKFGILRDGVALQEVNVNANEGSTTIIDTFYLGDVSVIELGAARTQSGDQEIAISAIFKVEQMP